MAEEFRFVDMAADEYRRSGADEHEARRRGLIAFGGVERYKEGMRDARGTRLLEDLVGDLVQSARSLRHNPRFAVIAILTLAVGIGGTSAVFSAVDAVLLKPLPYAEPGAFVRLYSYQVGSESDRNFVSGRITSPTDRICPPSKASRQPTPTASRAPISAREMRPHIRVLPVSADYFGVMRAQPTIGRAFQRSEETIRRS